MTSDDIRAALRDRLPVAEYALFFEVSNKTGSARTTSADAVSMSLWPSRGLEVIGFEIKVSRGDWLRELKNPAKAESIAQYCDRWVILAPDKLIAPAEIPAGWGMWTLSDAGRWSAAVTPPKLQAVPLDRSFIAALLRRASEADDGLVQAALHKLREGDEKRNQADVARAIARNSQRFEELSKTVKEFEQASGVSIAHAWNAGDIGRGVKIALELGNNGLQEQAKRFCDRLSALLEA